MRRVVVFLAVLAILLIGLAAPVQTQAVSSVVVTAGKGTRFRVDGREYMTSASFLWPTGSKHILEFLVNSDGYQYDALGRVRYRFSGWSENQSLLLPSSDPVQTVTADPRVTSYTATVTPEYRVDVVWFNQVQEPTVQQPSTSPAACGAPGTPIPAEFRPGVIYVDGSCYWGSVLLWLTEGPHSLNALPYPGFVFVGWSADTNTPDAFLRTFHVSGPLTLTPRFAPAKRVRFRTDPPGLKVLVDRAEVLVTDVDPCILTLTLPPGAPTTVQPLCYGDFDFLPGSRHTIGAPSPQQDKFGKGWIFEGFSNGMGQNALYMTGAEVFPSETLVARFVRGVSSSFLTKPSGLKLTINERDNWPSYHFVFAPGSRQRVSAPAEQTDARGRRYVFKGWSNGGAASQEVTIPNEPETGFVLVAEYELLSQVAILSNPAGTAVVVDGNRCNTPCRVDRADGVEVRLAAPETNVLSEVHRLDFVSWSDGAARERAFRLSGAETQTLTINYRTSYRLQTASDPPEAASFRVEPGSADGFYPADSFLTVTAGENPGFRFRRWDLDLEGTSKTATLAMTRPRTILARFDRVPFIAPAGVKNAAGDTPEGVVAPGSLITIYGANLAPYYEVGPASPLVQTLASVAVTVGNRILPLLFVSPEQINAQLPRDLDPGEHVIRVQRVGQPEVTGRFTITNCAPGLFSRSYDEQPFALAEHEDGTPITPSSPARRGEQVTVYGTGYGAYRLNAPAGFALPASPAFPLARSAEIFTGDAQPELLWAGGAPGMVGMDVVRFRVGEEMPAASVVPLKIRIDGHESNTVLLPVE